jgi:hypothetical protein
MKIKPEIYLKLKEDIKAVLDFYKVDIAKADGGTTGLKTMYLALDIACRNRAYDDTHIGYTSKAWTRVLPYDGTSATYYYQDGCNDTHLATALKQIKKEIMLNQ